MAGLRAMKEYLSETATLRMSYYMTGDPPVESVTRSRSGFSVAPTGAMELVGAAILHDCFQDLDVDKQDLNAAV